MVDEVGEDDVLMECAGFGAQGLRVSVGSGNFWVRILGGLVGSHKGKWKKRVKRDVQKSPRTNPSRRF